MKGERGVSLISLIIAILALLVVAGVIIALAINKRTFTNTENNSVENTTNTVAANETSENNA